jgi:hypothetical protein
MANALNATFFAFHKREKGGVLLGATIAFVVMAVLMVGAFYVLNAQAISDYIGWATSLGANMENAKPGAPPSMDMMMPPQSVMALGPMYLLFILFYHILLASYEAACLRWMIRGETGGVLGLSLGADTWRVYFGYWIWFFLLIAFYIVIAVVAFGLAGSFVAVGGAQPGSSMGGGMAVFIPLIVLALVLGLVYFAVRLAPAAATSIARRKFAFFDAWTVTKGRFWALLGAFVLLLLMFLVLCIVASIGMGAMIGMNAASHMAQNGEPESAAAALQMMSNPQVLVPIVVMYATMLIASMLLYLALFGVNARAALAAIEDGKIQAASA